MTQTSRSAQYIQVTYDSQGQLPNSNSQTYWKIGSNGSVLLESHVQQHETGDYESKAWQLDPSPTRFSEIERILKPAQASIGKECQTYPTVSIYWVVQWAPEGAELRLHTACIDAWARDIHRLIYAANEKVVLWMKQAYPDFDNRQIRTK